MGLGAPKRRNKLSHDPNNTTWANSTEGFGHKILCRQGWKPGNYLGAENAGHADHWTSANISHIRVALREDNLGLGAKIGGNTAATFGLSLFSGVLGRLNGKSEGEIEKQQNAMKEAELRIYHAQKYGTMNFIRGGLLVGDKIEPIKDQNVSKDLARVSKKRKMDHQTEDNNSDHLSQSKVEAREESSEEDGVALRSKRSKKPKQAGNGDIYDAQASENSTAKHSSTEERDRKKRKRRKLVEEEEALTIPKISSATSANSERSRHKAEKHARKAERRRRKEEKRLKNKGSDGDETAAVEEKVKLVSSAPIPASVAFSGSRHAVRQRYIQQKRMASMSAQAVKEIFMVKGTA